MFSRPRALNGRGIDGVTVLTWFLVLLVCIPSRLVVGALGSAGTPAQILGVLGCVWWCADRLDKPPGRRPPQHVRQAMLVFCSAVLISYIVASSRPIDSEELRAADRGLLELISWLGIFLVASDGPTSRARLDRLLQRLCLAGAALATLGITQFVTGTPFVDRLRIPGLITNSAVVGIIERDGFTRPAGTGIHPIEFGIVLVMVLPVALQYALVDRQLGPWRRWYPVVAIGAAVPISLSRSAIVATVVVFAFMFPVWPRARRRIAYVALATLMACMYVLVPGMLGTLTGLFTGLSQDGSAKSRTDSYALAGDFISRAPWFGRGFSTFLPSYRILDNSYLGVTIELGFVGLATLLSLFVVGVCTARGVRRRAVDEPTRHLAQALAASTAGGALSYATFDAFGFPMVAGLTFLVLGLVTALVRTSSSQAVGPEHPGAASRDGGPLLTLTQAGDAPARHDAAPVRQLNGAGRGATATPRGDALSAQPSSAGPATADPRARRPAGRA